MFLNFVKFGYFLLFGLLKVSIGHAFFAETGSDVSFVIELSRYPWSCKEIYIQFLSIEITSSSVWSYIPYTVMTSSDNGVQCLSNIIPEYEKRIYNASINFPISVTFSLRNVSAQDSGRYFAMDRKMFVFPDDEHARYGGRTLLVSDILVGICTLEQVDFVLPVSALNELVAVVFSSFKTWSGYTISICNPNAGTCAPPRSTFPRLECRINGSSIFITLKSVQMEDQGMYILIGSISRIIYQSALLNVTECVSTASASEMPLKNTELPNLTTGEASDIPLKNTEIPNLTTEEAAVGHTGISYSRAIISSAVPITDQSFVIEKEYFVGGSAMAGIVFVILTCRFIYKRCHGRIGSGADSDDYDTVDVHYYSAIRSQHECVPEGLATTGTIPESQQLSAVTKETNMIDDV